MGFIKRFNLDRLLLITAVILTATKAFAVDEVKNVIWTLDNFSGGLNTRLSEFSLPKEQGDIVENIRFDDEAASLTKRDLIKVDGDCGGTEPITGLHRLYLADGTKVTICTHGDEIEKKADGATSYTNILNLATGDRKWTWKTWHNVAIGSDGANPMVKYDGTSASATYVGSALALDAGTGAGPNGTYTYKVACYSTSYIVSLNTASNSVTVSDNDINLSMIPICPDTYLGEDIIGRKIYRIENGGSTYKLLTNGTIANNTATTLVDSDADAALGATLTPTSTETPPKGRFLEISKDRLWVANNETYQSRAYYSELSSLDIFYEDSYFDIRPDDGDEITGLWTVLGVLTIPKNNSIQKLDNEGDEPDEDWAVSDPFSFTGNQAPYSAVNSPLGVIYLGNNGINVFTGQYSQLLSDAVSPEIRDISPSNYANVWGEFFQNTYYMAYTSESSGATANDKILEYDTINKAFSIDPFGINVFTVFKSGSDIEALYSGSSTNGYVYSHTETSKEIVHRTHSDFTGTWDDMRYIPVEVGGDANDPELEIAWTETIDDIAASIDSVSGIIDRPDTDGRYISQYLTTNASTLDKLYWNEVIPISGGDVKFYVRTGSSTSDTAASAWNGPYTNSNGSDISAVSGDTIIQYRIDMTTDSIVTTPNVVRGNDYVVKVTFNTSGTDAETEIPMHWRSGWLDFGYPGLVKELKTVYVYYEWPADTEGTLNINFESYEGEEDDFEIDLQDNPTWYKEQFTNGSLNGELFRIDIQESSINQLKIKKIIVVFDVAPFQFYPI